MIDGIYHNMTINNTLICQGHRLSFVTQKLRIAKTFLLKKKKKIINPDKSISLNFSKPKLMLDSLI